MAKFLTDRKEIAKAINIDRYPTVMFDITKPYQDYERYYNSGKVLNIIVPWKSRNTELRYEADLYIEIPRERVCTEVSQNDIINNVKIGKAGCTCISSSFGPRDVYEMVENRQLQDVRPGDIIVVVFKMEKTCAIEMMKISERIDPHCSTMGYLEPID